MPEALIHRGLTWLEIGLAAITFLVLSFVVAPYGRHERAGFGKAVPQRLAWIAMEAPAVVVFIGIYSLGDHALEALPLCLLGIWQLHYLQRTSCFRFDARPKKRRPSPRWWLSAIGFNAAERLRQRPVDLALRSYSLADFQSFHFLIGA